MKKAFDQKMLMEERSLFGELTAAEDLAEDTNKRINRETKRARKRDKNSYIISICIQIEQHATI